VTPFLWRIADLTGKDHKHVLSDVRKMLGDLGFMCAEFSAYVRIPMPRGGFRQEEEFNLPKDLTFTLVLGYDVKRSEDDFYSVPANVKRFVTAIRKCATSPRNSA